jgi:uncharacterized protein (DUF2062 family)
MIPLATLWSDVPLPVLLIAVLAAVVIVTVIARPHLRRMHQRRQWRKLPPPPQRVEVQEPVLRLPRRHPGNRQPGA